MALTSKATDLRGLGQDELVDKLREAKQELFNLRFQSATGQLESHGRLRTVRHEIARIYTVMRERELGIIEADPNGSTAAAGSTGKDEAGATA